MSLQSSTSEFAVLAVTSLLVACAPRESVESDYILAPYFSDSINADGFFEESFWVNAPEYPLGNNSTVKFVANEQGLIIGISADNEVARYADLYFALAGDHILNLHASMQTGQRELRGNDWTDESPEWEWGRSSLWTASTTSMRPDASTDAPFHKTISSMDGYEFMIDYRLIGTGPWRMLIEYRDFVGHAQDNVLPEYGSRMNSSEWIEVRVERSVAQATVSSH